MKYVHSKWGDQKVFYISNGWSGSFTVKEHCKGAIRSKLELRDQRELNQFIKRLTDNGWQEHDTGRAVGTYSRDGEEIQS